MKILISEARSIYVVELSSCHCCLMQCWLRLWRPQEVRAAVKLELKIPGAKKVGTSRGGKNAKMLDILCFEMYFSQNM